MPENAVETMRMLVVSRETAFLRLLWSIGDSNSWHVETVASGWEAMERVQSDLSPHVLVLDIARGDGDSLHILRWMRRLRPALPVFVVCHAEDANRQKEATRLGAEAVLVRPFGEGEFEHLIREHLESPRETVEAEIASDDIESVGEGEAFVCVSLVMQKLRSQTELLAQADVPVLILGEHGAGKATVARLIHKLSIRSGFEFRTLNCATMPSHLLEQQLLGRVNGSSRSATPSKVSSGKLESAQKGTLLVEEITEMPLDLQFKLLQILQDNQLALSSADSGPVHGGLRVLATSSAKLDQALAEKRLREDLYYRLSAFTVHVPPLRQRKEEIKVLLQYSMHKLAQHYGLSPREFTPSVLEACVNHSWPGNLKELEAFVKRYLVAGDKEFILGGFDPGSESAGKSLRPVLLNPSRSNSFEVDPHSDAAEPKSLKSLIQSVKSETERNAISVALDKTRWNRKAAARLLKVSYRTLLYKIDQYHITAPEAYISPFARNEIKGNGRVG